MRTPSSARPAFPYGLVEGFGKADAAAAARATDLPPERGFAALVLTGFLADFLTDFLTDLLAAAGFRLAFLVAMVTPFTCTSSVLLMWPTYFLRTTLCGLRLPMRPLSVPAAGSIAALMRVGLPEFMASFTARLSS